QAFVPDGEGTGRGVAGYHPEDPRGGAGAAGPVPRLVDGLGIHLQRARLHGFTERELQDARAALIAEAEEAVRREATRPARAVLREINEEVTRGGALMSAAQTLALRQRLLPDITARQGSDARAPAFHPQRAIFIAAPPWSRA